LLHDDLLLSNFQDTSADYHMSLLRWHIAVDSWENCQERITTARNETTMKTRISSLLAASYLLTLQACSDTPQPPAPATPTTTTTSADQVQDEQALLDLEISLGSAVKRLCSSVHLSGRSTEHVMTEELSNLPFARFTFDVQPERVTFSASGMMAEAVYRPGLGCTLVKDRSLDELLAGFQPDRLTRTATPDDAEWPQGNRVQLPESVPGIDLEAVNRAVAQSFEDMQEDQNIRTRAVLVVHQGRIIAEQYAEPFNADMPQLGWSMTKTVTAALTGMMEADGLLDIDAPAPVPEWQAADDPRAAITLKDLMQMSSGLSFSEVYTAGSMSDVILMLYTTGDTGGFAAVQPLEHPPGTHFYYSSGTSNIISRILLQQFDDPHDYFNYPYERLFNPLGMSAAVMEPDESGVFVGSSYMYATPRDWARFGLLYLQDGVWNGERLLPEGFIERSITPATAPERGNYGFQVWLNAGAPGDPADRPMPNLPDNMFYLSGFEGQNVLMFPDQDLIVLRMGLTTSGPRPVWTLAERVLAAME